MCLMALYPGRFAPRGRSPSYISSTASHAVSKPLRLSRAAVLVAASAHAPASSSVVRSSSSGPMSAAIGGRRQNASNVASGPGGSEQ